MAIRSPPNYADSLATTLGFGEAGKYSALPQPLGVGAVLLGFSSDLCLHGQWGSGGRKDSWPHSLSPREGVWPQFHTHESALSEHGDWGQGGHRLCFTLSHKFWSSKISLVHLVSQQTSAEQMQRHSAKAWGTDLHNLLSFCIYF